MYTLSFYSCPSHYTYTSGVVCVTVCVMNIGNKIHDIVFTKGWIADAIIYMYPNYIHALCSPGDHFLTIITRQNLNEYIHYV